MTTISALEDQPRPDASDIQRAVARVLEGAHVGLRPLRTSDGPSLIALLSAPEVSRFIAPPPADIEAFARFVNRVNDHGWDGRHACFAVTRRGQDTAIGLFQIREIEAESRTVEWGFALGSSFWSTGVFREAAELLLAFMFNEMGIHRVEARAAVRNGRGGRALQKLGAVQEGVLRRAFFKNGEYLDQALYTIVADEWRANRAALAAVH